MKTGDTELARLQHEVNIASLKAAVHFMDRLQLRPMDGSGSDESGHVVSRLFIRYSNLILRLLDFARTDTVRSFPFAPFPFVADPLNVSAPGRRPVRSIVLFACKFLFLRGVPSHIDSS